MSHGNKKTIASTEHELNNLLTDKQQLDVLNLLKLNCSVLESMNQVVQSRSDLVKAMQRVIEAAQTHPTMLSDKSKVINNKDSSLTLLQPSSVASAFTYRPHKILRSGLLPDGKLEIVRCYPSMLAYPEGGGPPDDLVREIYVAVDGKIVLESSTQGQLHPPQTIPAQESWLDA